MRVVGLDIGEKRIGVAVSDATRRIASPLLVMDAAAVNRDPRQLSRLLEDYDVDTIAVGLPLSLDGSEGPQARRVRNVVAKLAPALGRDVVFVDERLSSAEAKQRMREAGVSERDQRGSVDMVAASLFLQSYLDANASTDTSEGS